VCVCVYVEGGEPPHLPWSIRLETYVNCKEKQSAPNKERGMQVFVPHHKLLTYVFVCLSVCLSAWLHLRPRHTVGGRLTLKWTLRK
jgi:hypothetical protein